MIVPGKRLAVFTIRDTKEGSIWTRSGTAVVNKDGSLNLVMDVFPMNGRLHVREAGERRDTAPPSHAAAAAAAAPVNVPVASPVVDPAASMGGH